MPRLRWGRLTGILVSSIMRRDAGRPGAIPPEFRRKVLDLVKAGRPVRQVAAELQMPSQTIYVWLRQDRIDTGLEPGLTSTDQAELIAARRRIAQLETELEATRRAIDLVKQAVPPKDASKRSR
ncbi:helix-turn-helix domain-containing protein [Actinomadura decatromicini]